MQNLTDNLYVLLILGMTGASVLVLLFILLQVRGRNHLLRQERRLQQMEISHQKELLNAVLLSQESERSRIGMDLHDEVGTVLASLRMTLQGLPDEPGDANADTGDQAITLIDQVMRSVREISHDLSPFRGSAYGLTDALEDLCERINRSGRLVFSLDYAGGEIEALLQQQPATEALALYRVVAELTQNTIKHAYAQKILLSIGVGPRTVAIHYHDDGRGLQAAGEAGGGMGDTGAGKAGMGMHNIESRLNLIGASFTIDRKPGQGFHMHIMLPLHQNPIV